LRLDTMIRLALITFLLCFAPSCSGTEQLHDNRSLRLEIAYQPETELVRRGGVDGVMNRSLVLKQGVLTLEQAEQTLQFDLAAFPGDTFVVYGTGLILPVVLDLPDGTRLHWQGAKLKVGERKLNVPRSGSFRYDAANHSLIAIAER
jgi:hypothetical protein